MSVTFQKYILIKELKICFTILALCLFPFLGLAQWSYAIETTNKVSKIDLNGDCTDSLDCHQMALGVIDHLFDNNYFAASIDKAQIIDSTLHVLLYVGSKYHTDSITLGNIPSPLLKELKIRSSELTSDYHPKRSKTTIEKILNYYSNNGFPYVSLTLDSVHLPQEAIKGHWNLNVGKEMVFDSIRILGSANIKKTFIHNYLNIEPYSIFNLSKIKKVEKRLRGLKFIELEESPEITVYEKWATMHLKLKPRNTSRFDLIFGIIPTEEIDDRNLFLSFDIKADLQNKFGFGETFMFSFERLRPEHQTLHLGFDILYPLNLPLGFDVNFDYFRRAFEYYDVQGDVGLVFPLENSNTFKIMGLFQSSRLIEIDPETLNNKLPDILDFTSNGLGFSFDWNNLDYIFNPRAGWKIYAFSSINLRKIIPNTQLLALSTNERDYDIQYEAIEGSKVSLQNQLHVSYFLPIKKRSTILTKGTFAYKFIPGNAVRNELFRLGGNQNLRGFDEESFFSPFYSLFTLEYRLLLAENAYLSLPFIDFSFFQNQEKTWNNTLGFGGGLSFETRAGILNLSLAVGRLNTQAFDLSRPKVHIGFNSLF